MAEQTKPIIGTYYNQLQDRILELGLERNQAEKNDLIARNNRKKQTTLFDVGTLLGVAGMIGFAANKRSHGNWRSVGLAVSFLTTVCSYVVGEQKKERYKNTPTAEAEKAKLLDLVIYEETIDEPAVFGAGGIYKYPETPQKYDFMKNRRLGIQPT